MQLSDTFMKAHNFSSGNAIHLQYSAFQILTKYIRFFWDTSFQKLA